MLASVSSVTPHQAQLWSSRQKWHVALEELWHPFIQTRWHMVLIVAKEHFCVQFIFWRSVIISLILN